MPYLKINTNISTDKTQAFITSASEKLAKALGKPEAYVMVELSTNCAMVFAGTLDAAAYVELKSIGLPASTHKSLSKTICELLESELNISAARTYIEFSDIKGASWGWNGSTF